MSELADDALYIGRVAIHEAAHVAVARAEGGQPTVATINFHDGTGKAKYILPTHNAVMRAAITVAGALGEAKFLGHRNWRQFFDNLSDHDKIVEIAESAGVGVEQLIDDGARRAKLVIDREWNSIRRLAKRILQAGGTLEFKK